VTVAKPTDEVRLSVPWAGCSVMENAGGAPVMSSWQVSVQVFGWSVRTGFVGGVGQLGGPVGPSAMMFTFTWTMFESAWPSLAL
jgi:hypothetical protein